jgi:hypothetical protein
MSQLRGERGNMLRALTRLMSCIWGYNGRTGGFQRGYIKAASSCFPRILRHPGAFTGYVLLRPVFLNTAHRYQESVGWIKKSFAQGAGLSRDRRQSIAQAILPCICQKRAAAGKRHTFFASGRFRRILAPGPYRLKCGQPGRPDRPELSSAG